LKAYIKTYFIYFGYDESSWIACECGCGKKAVDIHHLEPKSIAKKKINLIDNLCAVSRECHQRADYDRSFNDFLKHRHRKNLLSVKNGDEIVRYLPNSN